MISAILQTIGGLFLIIIGAIVKSIHADKKSLWEHHGRLRDDHSMLRSDHSALSARVQAESTNNFQNFHDLKETLVAINEKLDRIIEKR